MNRHYPSPFLKYYKELSDYFNLDIEVVGVVFTLITFIIFCIDFYLKKRKTLSKSKHK